MKSTKINARSYMPDETLTGIRTKHSEMCKGELAKMHLSNFLHNMPVIRKYPGIMGFEKIFPKTPAVVVGLGPSLTKEHIDLLKKYRDNIVIVAVDAALPVITKQHGLIPHMVVMVDPTEKQRDSFSDIDTTKFYTIVPPVVHPSIFRIVDPQHLAVYNIKEPGSMLMEIAPFHVGKRGALPAGVLTSGSAFAMAAIMGCSPIIFVGHDLSWPTPDKVYAEGTLELKQSFQKGTKFRSGCLLFPDINGELVLTHETFIVFWAWLRDIVRRMKQRVVNCSEAGILITEEIKAHPLKATLEKSCSKKLVGVEEKLKKAYDIDIADGLVEKLLIPEFKRI